jgi:hypothetical protein
MSNPWKDEPIGLGWQWIRRRSDGDKQRVYVFTIDEPAREIRYQFDQSGELYHTSAIRAFQFHPDLYPDDPPPLPPLPSRARVVNWSGLERVGIFFPEGLDFRLGKYDGRVIESFSGSDLWGRCHSKGYRITEWIDEPPASYIEYIEHQPQPPSTNPL